MIDFSLPPELVDVRDRTLAFVRDEVIPQEPYVEEHGGLPAERLTALREKARGAGLYAPHVSSEAGSDVAIEERRELRSGSITSRANASAKFQPGPRSARPLAAKACLRGRLARTIRPSA